MLRRYPLPFIALALMLVSGVLWLSGQRQAAQLALAAITLIGGLPLIWATLRQVLAREFGVDLIALLAITGSFLLGQYLAGALIVLMLSGGEALEAFALRRANKSLTALAERAPRSAHVWRDGRLIEVAALEVAVDQQVVVKPGELIPVDGEVVEGVASVSEADLTGEPLPVRKGPGAGVLSGSVNLDGVLTVRATRLSAESHYAQIVKLVEAAQRQKAPIHRLADRYGVAFTAVAVGIAAVAWSFSRDPLYAVAVLVVATPCPLILATPIAIMSGIDAAAHHGIIVKSGATIEQLAQTDVVVFDKTGTLTLGTPQVIGAVPYAGANATYAPEELFRLAASVEQFSAHILARAVVTDAHVRGIQPYPVDGFDETTGSGVRARVVLPGAELSGCAQTAHDVLVGNRAYLRAHQIEPQPALLAQREQRAGRGEITSFIVVDDAVVGLLAFADLPRPEVATLAPRLRECGIREVVLLTGDGPQAAERIGNMARVDRVVAQCLPADKSRIIGEERHAGHHVLVVGDGVNDAPALATADVGLAMVSHGLTAASNVADAVLLSADVARVADVVRLGRQVVRVALQGIWVGMGLSLVAMVFAAFGFIPPAAGAILQEGVDVIVILNALRAGRPSAWR
jgi:heavy metal translocating P-type ATPase